MTPPYVYLAGIGNSGPQHWQRLWQQQQGGLWVEHADWDHPVASLWVQDLEQAVAGLSQPPVLVAHSLGALLALHWLALGGRAAAAYLVALPDPMGPLFPPSAGGFVSPFTMASSVDLRLVASNNDSFASLDYAFQVAHHYKGSFWDLGARGHINADSGLGAWAEGWQDLQHFLKGLNS